MRKGVDGRPQVFVSLPVEWNFPCDFPENRKQDVREGFRYWDDMTDRDLFREMPGCGKVRADRGIVVTLSPHSNIDEDGVHALGSAYAHVGKDGVQTGGAMVLWREWRDETGPMRRSVTRHEVGHLLGFQHNRGWGTCLMYPYINVAGAQYLDREKRACRSEVREFRQHY
jgi:hypothetical protein